MSIKTDAIVIRDETVANANTATRVGTNLVAIADDLVAKQAEIDLNTAKTGITTAQADAIVANTAKVGVTTEEANPDVVSQAEAEAGTATTERIWTAQRVKQAIDALSGGGAGVDDTVYGISWDGVTGTAPSKNALYDFIESQVFKVDTTSNIIPIFWGGTQAEYDIDFPAGHPSNYFVIITDGAVTPLDAADITIADAGGLIAATNVEDALQENRTAINLNTAKVGVTTELKPTDIDTLAELNAIVADATLIDTDDSRLSDARTPTAHTHASTEVTLDTTNFDNNLSVADDTVQKAMETLDELVASGVTPAASDVTVTPTGNLASTNVQTALQELQTDIDVINGSLPTVITTINQYTTVANLPTITGSETDTYAIVKGDATNDLNGMYAIVGGAWKQIYHHEDYYKMPILIEQRNEIDLDSPDIVDGFTFDSAGAQVVNAAKYITNYIRVRAGEWLKKVNADTFALYDIDKVLIPTTDPAYNGGNTATNDFKIPYVDGYKVAYMRWSCNISDKNSNDAIYRQMFLNTTAAVTGWTDYHPTTYQRDNDKYTYEDEGVIFENYNTNLWNPLKTDYTERQNAVGTTWSGGFSSHYIPCNPGDVFSSTQSSTSQVTFYDEDKVYVSGVTDARAFYIPNSCYYFRIGAASADDQFSLIITKDRVAYEDYDECSTNVLNLTTLKNSNICLIGDSISSETQGYATSTALGSLTNRNLGLKGVKNISSSGKSVYTFALDKDSGFGIMPISDYYFIFLGTNDYGFANRTLVQFNADLVTLCETHITGLNADAKIAFITPIPRSDNYGENSGGFELIEFVDAIKSYASANGHDVLDLYNECGINPYISGFKTDWFISADGLHPNNDGQRIFLYPKISKFINKIINK